MVITQIKILGLFDNDDLVLRIMNTIDDEINNLGTTQEQIDNLLEIIDSHDFDNLELI